MRHERRTRKENTSGEHERMWGHCAVAVLGFSLNAHRRLQVINDEPCKASCDAGENEECDQQNAALEWKLSCDLHPTTSCDTSCEYFPPPSPSPLPPWLENGTYPSPPPSPAPPPEPDYVSFAGSVALLVFAVCLLGCACVWTRFEGEERTAPARLFIAYWCCCCVPFDGWERNERRRSEARMSRWSSEREAEVALAAARAQAEQEGAALRVDENKEGSTFAQARAATPTLDLPSLNLR